MENTTIIIGTKEYDVSRIVTIHREGHKAVANIADIDLNGSLVSKDIQDYVVIPAADNKFKAVLVPYTDESKPNRNPKVSVYILSKFVLKKADANAFYQTTQTERFVDRYSSARPRYDSRRQGRYWWSKITKPHLSQ